MGSVAAGTAVLAGATYGVLTSLDLAERTPSNTSLPGTAAPLPRPGTAQQPGLPESDTGQIAVEDGSPDRPWAQGTELRLGTDSCWIVSVDDVVGQVATLTLSCDQVGTSVYQYPTPSAWLAVYAVGQDGTVRRSLAEEATAQDTFWTQGNLADTGSVTTTVTLPDVGPLAAVAVQNTDDVGWYWDATG